MVKCQKECGGQKKKKQLEFSEKAKSWVHQCANEALGGTSETADDWMNE